MNPRLLIPTLVVALSLASPAYAASEITGTLTAGSSTVGGTVVGIPIASPLPGTYGSSQSVTLTSPGSLSIRYTTNGTAPSCTGDGLLYTGPISISSSLTIRAVSCYASGASSAIGIYAYTISSGTLTGTVATSSSGTLSGTVVASSGGSLSGTVVGPSSAASATSGGSSSGGRRGSSIAATTGTGVTTSGSVLGTSTDVPNLPNAGTGGDASQTMLMLAISAIIGLTGIAYLRYRIR